MDKARAQRAARSVQTFARLRALHPDAHCELEHRSAFELLVATVLSAQTTDKIVNKVTPSLFTEYPTPKALSAARPEEVARRSGASDVSHTGRTRRQAERCGVGVAAG